jgi:hypothetical protein
MSNTVPQPTLKDAALQYARNGYAVLPLKPGTKEPYTAHGLLDATDDVDEINRWWNTYPDSNIGLRPSQRHYVIDVDNHADGADGYTTLAALTEIFGPLPDDAPSADTPNGGRHIWIEYDGGDVVSLLGPGIDIKGHSGYVVVPPSKVGGKQYSWWSALNGNAPRADAWTAIVLAPPKPEPTTAQPKSTFDGDSVISAYNEAHSWADVLDNWTSTSRDSSSPGAVWLHPLHTSDCSATIGDDGRLYVYSTNTAFDVTTAGDPHGYDRFDAYTQLHHGGDAKAAVKALRLTGPKKPSAKNAVAATEFVGDEPTTWEPVDLEPCLTGEKTQPRPCLGMRRSDGVQLIYPGREHAILGDTESGKTWYALGCVVAELNRGDRAVYIHYEEPDETSTIERLLLLGVSKDVIRRQFRFYGPMRPVRAEWLAPLIEFGPSLVVHDGVNEAMALHSNMIKDVEGASEFRRRLVMPFTRAGIATLACDHLPLVKDSNRVAAYGTVHKGNALDGTRIMLENFKPFGREKRGVSNVYVTKDRPGFLRAGGKSTETPGKTFMGVLAVDDMTEQPEFLMRFYAPRNLDDDIVADSPSALPVFKTIYELPGHCVESLRKLFAELRKTGMQVREGDTRDTVDDLVAQGRLTEVKGKRNATGYRVNLLVGEPAPMSNSLAAFEAWTAAQGDEDEDE